MTLKKELSRFASYNLCSNIYSIPIVFTMLCALYFFLIVEPTSIMLKWKYFQHTCFTCHVTRYRCKLFGDFGVGSTLENLII